MMIKKRLLPGILSVAILSFSFAGCNDDDNDNTPVTPPASVSESRTLLVYCAAQNSLGGSFDLDNMDDMVEAATFQNIGNNKIVVLHDLRVGGTELLEISAGPDGQGRKVVMEELPDMNFDDPETFRHAVSEMKRVAPAQSYGLIMWSHASGWLPASFGTRSVQSRSVLEDGNRHMELDEFAEALPANVFDFIIFDECYMSGIEVLWAIKDKTDYVVASSAEVLGAGMPYDKIIPHIFAKDIRLGEGGVAQANFDYHNDESLNISSAYRSATIALFDCNQINDEFAGIIKDIIEANEETLKGLDREGIQFYDRYDIYGYEGTGLMSFFFEINDLVDALCEEDDPLRTAYYDKMASIVKYKATTQFVIGRLKDSDRFSGMTMYIPFSDANSIVNNEYGNTAWYQKVFPDGFLE